jgi:hypothetical protein
LSIMDISVDSPCAAMWAVCWASIESRAQLVHSPRHLCYFCSRLSWRRAMPQWLCALLRGSKP